MLHNLIRLPTVARAALPPPTVDCQPAHRPVVVPHADRPRVGPEGMRQPKQQESMMSLRQCVCVFSNL